jgi:uncharacterized membrane protein (DUF373 family)
MARSNGLSTPHTDVHRLSRRFLEPAQDVLMLGLGLALFGLMARTLVELARQLVAQTIDSRAAIAEVLFMLVMVELVRLLMIYLQEHRVAVDFMVELGIVATLREIVLRGVVELSWEQIAALSVFLLALGVLLRFGDLRIRSSPDLEVGRLVRDEVAESVVSRKSRSHGIQESNGRPGGIRPLETRPVPTGM